MNRPEKPLLLSLAAMLALVVLGGCQPAGQDAGAFMLSGFVPVLYVAGDVDSPQRIDREAAENLEWAQVEKDGEVLPCVNLEQLIALASPRTESYDLLLVGSDGLASRISGADLAGCYVAFSEVFSWECINENHPISSNIKMLQKIFVLSQDAGSDPGAVAFADGEGDRLTTPGNMVLLPLSYINEFEGISEIGGNSVTVYTPHYRFPLSELLYAEGEICVMGKDGSVLYTRIQEDIFVEMSGNRIDLALPGGETAADIAGILADPPKLGITETYHDALYFLEKGDPILIIELDGWGYLMSRQAGEAGAQPFLSLQEQQKALAVYPTISQAGLASMVTGTTPSVHGVHTRNDREFVGEDIFAAAKAMGKTCAYIEGETSLIATSLAPKLSPDLGGEAGTDDEVASHALQAIAGRPDLLFVHFHGIDDVATEYGPYAQQTLDKIKEVDAYVRTLAEAWYGKVIITADHGLHETEDGGAHGSFTREDLLVPYCILDGGMYHG